MTKAQKKTVSHNSGSPSKEKNMFFVLKKCKNREECGEVCRRRGNTFSQNCPARLSWKKKLRVNIPKAFPNKKHTI
jgi:molybdopterin synthase catalytic subunit